MAKKPEERYQTTTELAAAARQALSPDTAGRTTPNYRRRHAAGRARAPGQARRCHPHRNPSAGRRHRCTGFADTRSDRHIAAFAGESSADPTPSPSAAPQNHRGRHGVDHRYLLTGPSRGSSSQSSSQSPSQSSRQIILPFTRLARARRFGGEHCRRRLRRRSRQQPGDETRSALRALRSRCRLLASRGPSVWRSMPRATSTLSTFLQTPECRSWRRVRFSKPPCPSPASIHPPVWPNGPRATSTSPPPGTAEC